jgi:hypothetical protein
MEINESMGLKLYLVGTALILFFAIINPKDLIVAAGPAGFLFAFGGMLASGRWPYKSNKPKRNKRWRKFKR